MSESDAIDINVDSGLSLNFDTAVWEKMPLLLRNLGKESNYYRFLRGIFDVIEDNYLLAEDKYKSFGFLARQLFVASASGKFLDEHGISCGLSRRTAESDEAYRVRIKGKVILPYNFPSIGTIKSYVKLASGYDINIPEYKTGFIHPDGAEAEEVSPLVLANSNAIYNVKHITYNYDPLLPKEFLFQSLDAIISPFLTYYTYRTVSEETIEKEVKRQLGEAVVMDIVIDDKEVLVRVNGDIAVDIEEVERSLEEAFNVDGGYSFNIYSGSLEWMLFYYVGANNFEVVDKVITLLEFASVDTPILEERLNLAFGTDEPYTLRDPFFPLEAEFDIEINWGSDLSFRLARDLPEHIMLSEEASVSNVYVIRNDASIEKEIIYERLIELNPNKEYVIY